MSHPSPVSLVGLRSGSLLEAYRIFAEVVTCQSMSQAAWNLDLDVSVVSRQIANVERAFDCNLFERHRRGVRPTEAGQRVAEHVVQFLAQETRLRDEIRDLRKLRLGSVRVAATEGAIAGPLARVAEAFARSYPGVQVEMFQTSSEQILPALRRGDAELGVGLNIAPEPGIEIVARYDDILAAAVAPWHELAASEEVTFEQLHHHPIGTFERNSGVGRALQRMGATGAPTIRPSLVTNSLHALRRLAESGAGVALVCPHSIAEEIHQKRLVAVPLTRNGPIPMTLGVCVLQGKRRSFALDQFISELLKLNFRTMSALTTTPFDPGNAPDA